MSDTPRTYDLRKQWDALPKWGQHGYSPEKYVHLVFSNHEALERELTAAREEIERLRQELAGTRRKLAQAENMRDGEMMSAQAWRQCAEAAEKLQKATHDDFLNATQIIDNERRIQAMLHERAEAAERLAEELQKKLDNDTDIDVVLTEIEHQVGAQDGEHVLDAVCRYVKNTEALRRDAKRYLALRISLILGEDQPIDRIRKHAMNAKQVDDMVDASAIDAARRADDPA